MRDQDKAIQERERRQREINDGLRSIQRFPGLRIGITQGGFED